jgi:hypothetical protein
MTSELNRAVEVLGATLLTEGVHEGEYAYYDDGMHRYYVVEPEDLEVLGRKAGTAYNSAGDTYDYSLWCAETMAEEMPVGWEPGVQS